MLNFLMKRLLLMIPTLFGVTLVVFLVIQIVPGNPVDALVPPESSQEVKDQLIADLGLDQPLYIQYFRWLGDLLTGNLGRSIVKSTSVNSLLIQAFSNSLLLALGAAAFAFVFSILLGFLAAYKPESWFAALGNIVAIIGISVPNFWGGLILMGIFGVALGWLPPMGKVSLDGASFDLLKHMIMPSIAAGMVTLGVMTRMVRSSVYDLLHEEFVLTLRAKGVKTTTILRHVLKNATPSILTIAGLQFSSLLGGSILVETVFSWPGLGQLIYQGISQRDYPIIQSGILLISIFFVVLNIVVDLLHALLDPRVQNA
ncbi:ABC transporter permease [Paenibacillus sp. S150]|uniref:ABC transporter permease n=1 Tax=Paenibacillus sp. S150 TaxID=2749826 RepID=UPI001C58360C|nr:ABC transporter permease [Paenibacillus sp. S150]MBW4085208.1 ABC transporter permease [Paenibacillus sp. S150]